MSLNLVDLIKGQLGPALVSQAASQFGESESSISKAIGGLLPAVVGGLANNANNPAVVDAVSNAHNSGLLSNLLGGVTNNSLISTVISSIFGDKLSGLLNGISTFAGVNNSTAGSLLNLVTGATLGSVGKYAQDNNLGASGISGLLNDQKGIVSTLLPAGLSLATLGLGHFGGTHTVNTDTHRVVTDAPKVEVNRVGNTHVTPEPENKGGNLLKWLLPLLLLAGLAWWLFSRNKKADTTTTTTDSTVVVKDSANTNTPIVHDTTKVAAAVTKVDEDIDLNGTKLKGYKGGLEERMITFLKSGEYDKATEDGLKNTWYDFDHVNFKMASATELESGAEQIQNLVAILKQFPTAKVKIGGYTDKTGDAAKNKELSKQRAEFIKSELTKAGVGAQVTGAEGYGSEFATVPATASNDERAVDRKMSVRFSK